MVFVLSISARSTTSLHLGMAIDQFDYFSISVNQTKYIEKMLLKKFTPSSDVNSIKHNKPCSPESFSKLTFPVDDLERERVANLPYLQVVGSLLYIACMTRPDIAYHVSMLSKFMHDPSQGCFDAAITPYSFTWATPKTWLDYITLVRQWLPLDMVSVK